MDIEEADEFRRRVAAIPEPYQCCFDTWMRDYVGPLDRAPAAKLAEAREVLLEVEKYFGRFGDREKREK